MYVYIYIKICQFTLNSFERKMFIYVFFFYFLFRLVLCGQIFGVAWINVAVIDPLLFKLTWHTGLVKQWHFTGICDSFI